MSIAITTSCIMEPIKNVWPRACKGSLSLVLSFLFTFDFVILWSTAAKRHGQHDYTVAVNLSFTTSLFTSCPTNCCTIFLLLLLHLKCLRALPVPSRLRCGGTPPTRRGRHQSAEPMQMEDVEASHGGLIQRSQIMLTDYRGVRSRGLL